MKKISLLLIAVAFICPKVVGKDYRNLSANYYFSNSNTIVQVKNDSVKSKSLQGQSKNSDEKIREITEDILPPEERIYNIAEKMPSFPGGFPALKEYLKENFKFPEEIKGANKAVCKLIIDTDGSIFRFQYMNSVDDPTIKKEIERVIYAMPKWQPGMNKGKAVKTVYILQIFFDKKKYDN